MNRLDPLKDFWNGLTPDRRRNLVVATVLAVVAVLAVGVWSASTPQATLLEHRSWDELLDAAAALDAAEVPYSLAEGRLTVPSSQLGKARAALADSEALPGLADVSELQLGLTPQAQSWAFLRAREGDLARMINGIEGVSASRVNIVPQKEALFIGEQSPATASVFVKLRPGGGLSDAQVRAVTNLVGNAVEGLNSEGVTVVDDRGNLLAEGGQSLTAADAAQEALFSYRAKVEERYTHAVTRALLPVLGWDGGFSVTTNVAIDATSSETVSKRLDAEAQAMVSEQLEESSSTSQQPNGVPGVDANLPERPAGNTGTTNQEERSAATTNYTYPTIDEVVRRPAGDIERVSVAVQVDSARVASLAEAGGTTTEELQQRIEQAVQAAVGFDAQRGDLVAVHVMPFVEREWVEGTVAPSVLPAELLSVVPYAVAALAIVMLFLVVVRPLVQQATAPVELAVADSDEVGVDEDGNVVSLDERRSLAARLEDLLEAPDAIDATQLSSLVDEQPEAAAKVLRLWSRPAESHS